MNANKQRLKAARQKQARPITPRINHGHITLERPPQSLGSLPEGPEGDAWPFHIREHIGWLNGQIQALESRNRSLDTELELRKYHNTCFAQEIVSAHNQVYSMQQRIDEVETEKTGLSCHLAECQKGNEHLMSVAEHLDRACVEVETRMRTCDAENKDLKRRCADLHNHLEQLRQLELDKNCNSDYGRTLSHNGKLRDQSRASADEGSKAQNASGSVLPESGQKHLTLAQLSNRFDGLKRAHNALSDKFTDLSKNHREEKEKCEKAHSQLLRTADTISKLASSAVAIGSMCKDHRESSEYPIFKSSCTSAINQDECSTSLSLESHKSGLIQDEADLLSDAFINVLRAQCDDILTSIKLMLRERK